MAKNVVTFQMDVRMEKAVRGILEVTKAQDKAERGHRKGARSLGQYEKKLNKSYLAARRFMGVMAGSAALGGLVTFGKRVIESTDKIGKMADKLGLGVEALQEYRHAAEISGIAAGTFDMGLQRLGRRLAEAAKGKGEARNALVELGVELVDSEGRLKTVEQILPEIADRMNRYTDQIDRNRIAQKLFDSEAVVMVNLLREGSVGMAKLRQQARDTGQILDEQMVRNAEKLNDRLTVLSGTLSTTFKRALLDNIQPISQVVGKMSELIDLGSKGVIAIRATVAFDELRRFEKELGRLQKHKAAGKEQLFISGKGTVPLDPEIAGLIRAIAERKNTIFSTAESNPLNPFRGSKGPLSNTLGAEGKRIAEQHGQALSKATSVQDQATVATTNYVEKTNQLSDKSAQLGEALSRASGAIKKSGCDCDSPVSKGGGSRVADKAKAMGRTAQALAARKERDQFAVGSFLHRQKNPGPPTAMDKKVAAMKELGGLQGRLDSGKGILKGSFFDEKSEDLKKFLSSKDAAFLDRPVVDASPLQQKLRDARAPIDDFYEGIARKKGFGRRDLNRSDPSLEENLRRSNLTARDLAGPVDPKPAQVRRAVGEMMGQSPQVRGAVERGGGQMNPLLGGGGGGGGMQVFVSHATYMPGVDALAQLLGRQATSGTVR